MSQTSETTPASNSQTSTSFASGLIALVVMVVLFTAVGLFANYHYNRDVEAKRAAFEHVLDLSSSELESKSVVELNSYRQDIEKVARRSLLAGNISGYDDSVVNQELKQINDLILKKTDR